LTKELFSVVQFFPNGTYEYVRTNVEIETAILTMRDYTRSVGAQIGTTQRVIITDMGDETVAEWQFGKGIVFPPVQP
jgi:hypothetical protein